ncbi:MAG: hypothetical protein IPH11_09095 [Ignavibacteriales bacterium]|nr:hypothetical protein [Ignavibacteriales bacterium]
MKQLSFLIVCTFILLTNINLEAQSFRFGLKLEMFGLVNEKVRDKETYSTKFVLSETPSIYAVLHQGITESFSINLKPGILFTNSDEGFTGFELAALVEKKLSIQNIFLSGGVNLHLNMNHAYGTGWVDVSDVKLITFILLGAGYQFNENLSFDLTVHQALQREYGYDTLSPDEFNVSGPKKMLLMIKIGILAYF